jgi:hypothetical protein
MKYGWLGYVLFVGLAYGGSPDSGFNVNSRYAVEDVVVSGEDWTTNVTGGFRPDGKLSRGLWKELAALIGEKLNPTLIEKLSGRLRKELHARTVEHHVLRGGSPGYVQVVFDVRPSARFDVSVPRFLYQSKQTWTGAVEVTATIGHNGMAFGLVSDGDELAERYTGLAARFENDRLGTERVRMRFQFESYREQWEPETLQALARQAADGEGRTVSGIYRTRQNFEPEASFQLAKTLTLSVGASLQRVESQLPASKTESANALTVGLRYRLRVETSGLQHAIDGRYSLHSATRVLNSDFAYTRQGWELRYMMTHGKSVVIDDLSMGLISGRAPLFERFVLGSSKMLRGWNKYELDPLGGSRMVHNSVEYRYGALQAFYDSGAVWDRGSRTVVRHSVGFGLRRGQFLVAVAFPVRERHMEPIFMAGMNY